MLKVNRLLTSAAHLGLPRTPSCHEARDLTIRPWFGAALVTEALVEVFDAVGLDKLKIGNPADQILKKIAQELAVNLHRNESMEWSMCENVSAKPPLMFKRNLRKYEYTPNRRECSIQLLLEQN